MPALMIGAVLGAAVLSRLLSAGRVALWRDEVQFMEIAGLPDPGAVLAFLVEHESHPPLYYILGHFAASIFGSVQVPMTVLAIAAAVVCVYLVYVLGARAFDIPAAVIAALATAGSAALIVFSVQLRPYALLTALLLAASGALFSYWTSGRARDLSVWAIATVLALYTHHVAVLVFMVQVSISVWLQWRGPSLPPAQLRSLVRSAVIVVAASLPALWLLVVQSRSAGYPAVQPFEWTRPFAQLLTLGLTFPFEVLLPLVVGIVAVLGGALIRDPQHGALAQARPLITAVAPLYFLVAAVASYRSQFLVPHLILLVAPFGMLLIAGHISGLWQRGHRWRAGIWGEVMVAAIVVGAILLRHYTKTNTRELAASMQSQSQPSDLIVLVPGAAGASFNYYFAGRNPQIDFPHVGALRRYEFDDDFSKVTDLAALQTTLDSIDAAFLSRRRVWLVTDYRWLHDDLPAPEILSRSSFGGIGQPDRARANLLDRRLIARFGGPAMVIAPDPRSRGQELLTARLYSAPPAAPDSPSVYGGAVR